MCEYIVSWHCVWPQVMAVGPERGYQEEYCHPGKQESAGPEIVILVTEEKVHHHHRYIGKPEKIRDDEHFTERDIVIKRYMDDLVTACDSPFQVVKPRQIDDAVDDQRKCMPVFLDKLNGRTVFLH